MTATLQLTVLDLCQCFFWGAFAILPLGIVIAAGETDEDGKRTALIFIGCVFQTVAMIAAYKAGGK